MKLYGFYRSSASYRIRIVLNIKGIDWENISVRLDKGDQFENEHVERNPMKLVPVLDTGDQLLAQSLAIAEYLDSRFPEPALLPGDPIRLAQVREMQQIISSDIQPVTNLRVLELLPGGGWYTKILAPVLRDNGELHVAIGTNRVRDNLLKEEGFDKVNVIEVSAAMPADGEFGGRTLGMFAFNAGEFDLVLTFRNMHNFTEEGRANINAAVYDALAPGGLYGVVDHSRRHMEPATRENRRRADVVQIILEAQHAGFDFVDYSDLHYRADDELRYEVGRKSVTGNSDRFTLLFRRPQ